MALTALLEFGDNSIKRYSKQYLVSDCHFIFDRTYNTSSPDHAAKCERIEVVLVAPGKDDLGIVSWFSTQEVRSGRIVITLTGDAGTDNLDTQVVYFEEAKCFSLSETYDISTSRRRLFTLSLIAESIEIDGLTFKRI